MAKIEYYSSREITKIRKANRIVAQTLKHLAGMIEPGISTFELDEYAKNYITRNGGKPAFFNYNGFPANICVSLNEQVVHGIPSRNVKLRNGDIISVDVGVELDGFFGDAAHTFKVGIVGPDIENFLDVGEKSLYEALKVVAPGNYIGDIGNAVQKYVEKHGYSVVREYVGHGIGRELHEPPSIPNYGRAKTGAKLEKGMVVAIEPMINMGKYHVKVLEDNWTVVTKDESLSAHFEHSVAVTATGCEILSIDE